MASLNDQKVLAFMFDPFLLEVMNNEQEENGANEQDKEELSETQRKAQDLEVEGIRQASGNQLEQALASFERAIDLWPDRASIYNNRAQVYRLKNQIDDAKADLDRAILLSDRSEEEAEGHNHNRNELIVVARQAYCQRALIHLLRENKEQGLSDMSKSASMGSGFAKSYMAKLNPYAALCNQMLQEMFEQYRLPSGEKTCNRTN